jgi:hypothetical protein
MNNATLIVRKRPLVTAPNEQLFNWSCCCRSQNITLKTNDETPQKPRVNSDALEGYYKLLTKCKTTITHSSQYIQDTSSSKSGSND